MEIHAEGENFRIHVADGMILCDVWKQGAGHWAQDMGQHLTSLATTSRTGAYAMILDLSDGPQIAGATGTQLLGKILEAWEAAGRRAAIIVSDHPLQGLQLRRLAKDKAPSCVKVFEMPVQAMEWASGTTLDHAK